MDLEIELMFGLYMKVVEDIKKDIWPKEAPINIENGISYGIWTKGVPYLNFRSNHHVPTCHV